MHACCMWLMIHFITKRSKTLKPVTADDGDKIQTHETNQNYHHLSITIIITSRFKSII